jgi:pimeloyl-ACP methyl ester carboxylesterase
VIDVERVVPSARVNNCEIYYELHGSGPVLAFIHGESHGIEMFERQIPHFARRFTCLTYYRRGHGRSELASHGYSVWNQSLDLEALLEHLGIERMVIIAVAMSTTVAVTYAVRRPERVRALVLASWYELDGYPRLERRRGKHGLSFAEQHLRMFEIQRTQGREALIAELEEGADKFLPIFPRDPTVRSEVIRMFASHAPQHYVQSAELYTSIPNLIPQMDRIDCPILGICGDDDPSPDNPELLRHLPNFKQVWIKGARRFTMMERPLEFNSALEQFLDTVGFE